MQKKGANISLKGYDDIFSTDQSRAEAQQERVQEIPLSELHPFEGHPFRVVDDEDMMKTVESVRDFGVLTPAIVRPDPDGGYEIISGHRRHRASELAGKETMPAIWHREQNCLVLFVCQTMPLRRTQARKLCPTSSSCKSVTIRSTLFLIGCI